MEEPGHGEAANPMAREGPLHASFCPRLWFWDVQWLPGHQQVFVCTVGFAGANKKKKRGRTEVGTWVGMFAPVLGPCFKK